MDKRVSVTAKDAAEKAREVDGKLDALLRVLYGNGIITLDEYNLLRR